MSPSLEPSDRARASCFHCRNSKRRCDKTLPSCQLCRRKALDCRYPRRRGQTSDSPDDSTGIHNGLVATTSSITSYHDNLSESAKELVTATAIRYLAPDLFRDLRLQVPRLDWDVPSEVTMHLGDRQQMQDTTTAFIRLTRSWMPIVNVKRHLAAILNPLQVALRRPRALLALCMKLCCLSGYDTNERHMLYLLVKRFYAEVERMEDACLEVMQSAVFIAVFELGDAIYPAAYLTVGALARYGMAMGIDKINKDALGNSVGVTAGESWANIEEMRRVWWATLVLDRFLNFSHPSRNLSTADPSSEDFLPVDDECFHNETSKPQDATCISMGFSFEVGAFARLCQATHLVSKVLVICQSGKGASTSYPHEDAVQLCRTLEALVRVNELEVTARRLAFCAQSTVSYIGILLLQQHHWHQLDPQEEHNSTYHMFPETQSVLDTLDRISTALQQGGHDTWQSLEGGWCTPFFVELVYQTMLAFTKMSRWSPPQVQCKKESLRWLLSHMRKRWPLVSVYERILETREMMLAAEAASR